MFRSLCGDDTPMVRRAAASKLGVRKKMGRERKEGERQREREREPGGGGVEEERKRERGGGERLENCVTIFLFT